MIKIIQKKFLPLFISLKVIEIRLLYILINYEEKRKKLIN